MSMALRSLQQYRCELLEQRNAIEGQIQALEQALCAMGGRSAPARVGRPGPRVPGRRGPAPGQPPRPGSLKSHILDVLRGRGIMAVKDITDAVVKGGYRSKNKTLAKSVGIALTEMKNVAKVGRGRFRLK